MQLNPVTFALRPFCTFVVDYNDAIGKFKAAVVSVVLEHARPSTVCFEDESMVDLIVWAA